ncbi:hypothetical protein PYCCODRAFT_1472788 [Trametes coccinea BRFM310]|uniref:Uncharacterized protein n=1 Tax=Trametes coccinea (strain BRFM310) TaxID=1353009 RepID=A0A1Y2I6G4_TRAC3|nr:hypothetical protein PYCCODRAFT_1472788 [Trametes coccinea BRFM310]
MARLDHGASAPHVARYQHDPVSRLPAYCASHLGRYHPYPRLAAGPLERRSKSDADVDNDALHEESRALIARPRHVAACAERPDPDTSPLMRPTNRYQQFSHSARTRPRPLRHSLARAKRLDGVREPIDPREAS